MHYFLRSFVNLALALVIVNCLMFSGLSAVSGSQMPEPALKIPLTVTEKSISTYVPSRSSVGNGLAVNIIYPEKPRYADGAPIAVVIPGANRKDGLGFSAHCAQDGFVEVRFAFPGGGIKNFQSGGRYDDRGQNCKLALCDVLKFVAGKSKDYMGRRINDLMPVKVNNANVGIVGWSNGGNLALITLDDYSEQLSGLIGWLVLYECPLGSIFMPGNLGNSQDLLLNNHYKSGSCATGQCMIDFRKLCFQPGISKSGTSARKAGQPDLDGVLFFDENNNKVWDESIEYAFTGLRSPNGKMQIYPPQVVRACERLNVFGGNWPSTIASVEDSQIYYDQRDGSLSIGSVCAKYPKLLVMFVATAIDHYQTQADHPHIAYAYNLFLAKKCFFLKLNPDPCYVNSVADMNVHNFVKNEPKASIIAENVIVQLEPEGLLPDYAFVQASACELADRLKFSNYKNLSDKCLATYMNSARAKAKFEEQAKHAAKNAEPDKNSKETKKNVKKSSKGSKGR